MRDVLEVPAVPEVVLAEKIVGGMQADKHNYYIIVCICTHIAPVRQVLQ